MDNENNNDYHHNYQQIIKEEKNSQLYSIFICRMQSLRYPLARLLFFSFFASSH